MKKKKIKKEYIVYQILFDGEPVYIGRTNDISRREKDHNRCLKNGFKKELYDFLREKGVNEIKLEPIYTMESLVMAKRMECWLILSRFFNNPDQLKQKPPNISDR